MIKNLIAIGLGGFAGSISRYLLTLWVDKKINAIFPYGTLTVNLIGCLLLGFLFGIYEKQGMSESWRLLLAVGFCGSFTTFSTFSVDNYALFNDGAYLPLFLNVAVSVFIGFALAAAGVVLARSLF